jgi:hypothetical protein
MSAGRIARLVDKDDCPADTQDPARRVRAALIRYLLEGGCDGGTRPNPNGVKLLGGWIDGELDLQGCRTELDLSLHHCLFPQRPSFRDAELRALYLTGSRAEHGLNLQRLRTETNVHLSDGFHATGLVDLSGARITGQLACVGGCFDGAGGRALTAEGATAEAQVLLSDGFHATGEVNLRGARITEQLACTGGRFDGAGGQALTAEAATVGASVFLRDAFHATGPVNFNRARIEGNLRIEQATLAGGIDLEAARVTEGLILTDLRGAEIFGPWQPGAQRPDAPERAGGVADLTDASCGVLRDDPAAWGAFSTLKLGNFLYDRIAELGTAKDRLAWLDHGSPDDPARFDPQPYTQLAATADKLGHRRVAARVRERREDGLRRADWARRHEAPALTPWPVGPWAAARLRIAGQFLFKGLFGYGHAPARALISVAVILAVAWAVYGTAYTAGQMAPNSDVVLTSGAWKAAVATGCAPVDWAVVGWSLTAPDADCTMPLHRWLATAPAAADYESFNAGLYALDLFVPLDALGQERTWAPSRDRGWLGYALRMPIQMAGWLITAVGAAVLTGLVGRKD